MRPSIRLIIYFLVLFVWTWVVVAPARAQPELRVGQEVELFYIAEGKDYSCRGEFRGRREEGFVVGDDESIYLVTNVLVMCTPKVDEVTGYRILKPAPRPEFKLPWKRNNPMHYDGGRDITLKYFGVVADELRYLRKEIEALKK
ncbi:hypothetical protein LCGC14_1696630 [marine sediment metagenome]|uniref:Uncharacterized protein n=1 Tax=marine sediment metagenome TaxID=412755 RepID=A0A0F9HJN5_9ZZZZ